MRSVTKKWLFQKLSSAILLPLMIWFIINFVSIYDKSYIEIGVKHIESGVFSEFIKPRK